MKKVFVVVHCETACDQGKESLVTKVTTLRLSACFLLESVELFEVLVYSEVNNEQYPCYLPQRLLLSARKSHFAVDSSSCRFHCDAAFSYLARMTRINSEELTTAGVEGDVNEPRDGVGLSFWSAACIL